jgi:GDPmannose 4,6-dehydratase
LFGHESHRRGQTFVTRKIRRAVAGIKAGIELEVEMGNLDAVRDRRYTPEHVEVTWRGYTSREFAQTAFDYAGFDWHPASGSAPLSRPE